MIANESFKSLVNLGKNGFYPLFHHSWIEEIRAEKKVKMNKGDQKKAQDIADRINQHRHLDRKRTVLLSLSEDDRKLFIRHFFQVVEQSILEEKPILQ